MNLYNYINNNEFKYEIFVSNNKEIPFQMITFINRENRLIYKKNINIEFNINNYTFNIDWTCINDEYIFFINKEKTYFCYLHPNFINDKDNIKLNCVEFQYYLLPENLLVEFTKQLSLL